MLGLWLYHEKLRYDKYQITHLGIGLNNPTTRCVLNFRTRNSLFFRHLKVIQTAFRYFYTAYMKALVMNTVRYHYITRYILCSGNILQNICHKQGHVLVVLLVLCLDVNGVEFQHSFHWCICCFFIFVPLSWISDGHSLIPICRHTHPIQASSPQHALNT